MEPAEPGSLVEARGTGYVKRRSSRSRGLALLTAAHLQGGQGDDGSATIAAQMNLWTSYVQRWAARVSR